MKALILLAAILLTAGCGNNSTHARHVKRLTQEEEKVVRIHEHNDGNNTYGIVLLDNGVAGDYLDGDNNREDSRSIINRAVYIHDGEIYNVLGSIPIAA